MQQVTGECSICGMCFLVKTDTEKLLYLLVPCGIEVFVQFCLECLFNFVGFTKETEVVSKYKKLSIHLNQCNGDFANP